jgi:hypothetical protein
MPPPPFNATGHGAGGATKGELTLYCVPEEVGVRGEALESLYTEEEYSVNSKSCVPGIAVKGDVGGVKGPVYTADPVTTRKFVIYPVNELPSREE